MSVCGFTFLDACVRIVGTVPGGSSILPPPLPDVPDDRSMPLSTAAPDTPDES